jgi:hypothetical protein
MPPNAAYRQPASGKKLVAIAVPLSTRSVLHEDEQISLRHLTHYLAEYDKFLIHPSSVRLRLAGFDRKPFDDRYFGSVAANTQMMLSQRFYEAFSDYEFVLIYHFDALVFNDDLVSWCQRGYDYLGAPWLTSLQYPERGFCGVGNGGFSLRRVASMLKVIRSESLTARPSDYWNKYFAHKSRAMRALNWPRYLLKHLRWRNNVRHEIRSGQFNEDVFWARRAVHYCHDFKIAPVDVALQFAFECAPRVCFARNNNNLPFGCHAWPRYDREFWEPYLLRS